MPWVALVDRAARRPDAAFSFEIDDRVEEVARPGDDPRFQSRSLIARVLGLDTYRPQDRPRYCDKPPPGMSGHQWRKHVAEILRERERAGDP